MVEGKSKRNAKLAEAGAKGLIYGCALGYELLDKGEKYYRILGGAYLPVLVNLAVGVGYLIMECAAADAAGTEADLARVVQQTWELISSTQMLTLDLLLFAGGTAYGLGNYKQDSRREREANPIEETVEILD